MQTCSALRRVAYREVALVVARAAQRHGARDPGRSLGGQANIAASRRSTSTIASAGRPALSAAARMASGEDAS
jgi:hypothetical protein